MWGYPEFYIPVPGGYGTETHGHLGLPTGTGTRRLLPQRLPLSRNRRPRQARELSYEGVARSAAPSSSG